jgi:hypothetical protein
MANYSYHLRPNESWGKGSVEIGPPAEPGESRTRRLDKTHDRLVTAPIEGINTVHDVLLYASRTHGERSAFGYRDIVDIIEEQKEVTKTVGGEEVKETKTWKYFHLSDYKYISFVELKEITSEVSRGLLKLGVQKNDVFNIYAQTGYVQPLRPLDVLPLFLSHFHLLPFPLFSPRCLPLLLQFAVRFFAWYGGFLVNRIARNGHRPQPWTATWDDSASRRVPGSGLK